MLQPRFVPQLYPPLVELLVRSGPESGSELFMLVLIGFDHHADVDMILILVVNRHTGDVRRNSVPKLIRAPFLVLKKVFFSGGPYLPINPRPMLPQ